MKEVAGERILHKVRAERKGNGTPFELGVGVVTDGHNEPIGQVRIRTEQINSGVAPVVGTLDIDSAEEFAIGLLEAIDIAKKADQAAESQFKLAS